MARPIVIEFAANVRDFLRGTRDVERATADIADELQDAGRDAERFERQFQESMRDAERAADQSSRKIERDFDRAGDGMGELGTEVGDEFVGNIGESIGSGDVGSIIQDTIGGVVGGLRGPMAAAGAGLAGIAVFAFQKVQEETERMEQMVSSWSDNLMALITETADALDTAAVEEGYRQWIEDNKSVVEELTPKVESLGLDVEAFWRKVYEGGEGAQEVLGELDRIMSGGTELVEGVRGLAPVMSDAAKAAGDVQTKVLGLVDGQEDATDWASTYAEVVGSDALDAVQDVRSEWAGLAGDLRSEGPVVLDVEVRTRVTGDGQAYVNPNSSKYTPSAVAGNNVYRGSR